MDGRRGEYGQLTFTGAPGEANRVRITVDELGRVLFTDARNPVVAVGGCERLDAHTARCRASPSATRWRPIRTSGPAALAKAYRFVGDARDLDTRDRLRDLNGAHGIWDCTRCYFCNQRCPKGVDPRDAIAKLGAA